MNTDRNRAIVLRRVRDALGDAGEGRDRERAVADRLRRHPRGTIPAQAFGGREDLIDRLTAKLQAQGADVVRAATGEDAVVAISAALGANDLPHLLRLGADPLLAALPWRTVSALELRCGKAEASDKAGLSRAVGAAAETGTLFLVSGADTPTTVSFLPEQHIVIVGAEVISGAYEEAFDRLRAIYGEGALPRSVNMISGPSRTADIEQTIVRGAHGPKRLLVVILG